MDGRFHDKRTRLASLRDAGFGMGVESPGVRCARPGANSCDAFGIGDECVDEYANGSDAFGIGRGRYFLWKGILL